MSGFSIFGKVLNSNNGAPLGKAIVHVNGKPVAKTDGNGRYTLEKMKAGIYNIFITYGTVYCIHLQTMVFFKIAL